jgi:hypothetical protein
MYSVVIFFISGKKVKRILKNPFFPDFSAEIGADVGTEAK